LLLITIFGWFGTVIREGEKGMYSDQVDRSFRWGMIWFIFSEVMFFAAFFGALFYARSYSVPWLGGESDHGRGDARDALAQIRSGSGPPMVPADIGGFLRAYARMGVAGSSTR
jgi:cytochrome c oxidase subunit 3